MALGLAPYYEARVCENLEVTGTVTFDLPAGLGGFSELVIVLSAAEVSGGDDTLNAKVQTTFTRDSDGEDEWLDVAMASELSAGSGGEPQPVAFTRSEVVWSSRNRVVVEAGDGTTATGVAVTVVGSMSAAAAV